MPEITTFIKMFTVEDKIFYQQELFRTLLLLFTIL